MTNVAHLENGPLVISRPDRIGDVVISTSWLAPLRKRFPEREIYFLATEALRPLLDDHPLLAGFVSLQGDLTRELKRISPAAIVHLHPDADCYRAGYNAGIPVRIGYSERRRNRYLTHKIADRRAEGLQHEGDYCFDLLQILGVEKPATLTPSIHLSETDRSSMQKKLPWDLRQTHFAILNTSAYSPKREWPAQHLLQLANEVERRFTLPVVFVGAHLREEFDGAHLNLSGRTTLGEISWLVRYAKVLVTTDTGTSHLAAAVNCPTVIIFGRSEPQYGPTRWRPLSSGAVIVASTAQRRRFEATKSFWRRAFAEISVQQVLAALAKILRNQSETTAAIQPASSQT